ncbi:MAG: dihydroneopterin aldolase, partial [Sinomicrobium sp.]|nr:dihydroneopterin aldolase [Sinomicrobium sp.]
MGSIKIRNIQLYAYHGCLAEEGKIGGDYRVDVEVKADLGPSAKSDSLQDTVNYVHVNRIVREEMAVRSKLLEHVAGRILDRIFAEIAIAD